MYVPAITTDESIDLRIVDLGDDEDENPVVKLQLKELRPKPGSANKIELVRAMFRFCRFSDLEDPPARRTKGGAIRRMQRNLVPIKCQCGCGMDTSGGMFRQGHDAKLKSRLRKVMDGRITDDPKYTEYSAEAELRERGWLS